MLSASRISLLRFACLRLCCRIFLRSSSISPFRFSFHFASRLASPFRACAVPRVRLRSASCFASAPLPAPRFSLPVFPEPLLRNSPRSLLLNPVFTVFSAFCFPLPASRFSAPRCLRLRCRLFLRSSSISPLHVLVFHFSPRVLLHAFRFRACAVPRCSFLFFRSASCFASAPLPAPRSSLRVFSLPASLLLRSRAPLFASRSRSHSTSSPRSLLLNPACPVSPFSAVCCPLSASRMSALHPAQLAACRPASAVRCFAFCFPLPALPLRFPSAFCVPLATLRYSLSVFPLPCAVAC